MQPGQVAPSISQPGEVQTIVPGHRVWQQAHGVVGMAAVVVPLHFGHLPAGARNSGSGCDWASGWVGCDECSCEGGGVAGGTNGEAGWRAWRWLTGGGERQGGERWLGLGMLGARWGEGCIGPGLDASPILRAFR